MAPPRTPRSRAPSSWWRPSRAVRACVCDDHLVLVSGRRMVVAAINKLGDSKAGVGGAAKLGRAGPVREAKCRAGRPVFLGLV